MKRHSCKICKKENVRTNTVSTSLGGGMGTYIYICNDCYNLYISGKATIATSEKNTRLWWHQPPNEPKEI